MPSSHRAGRWSIEIPTIASAAASEHPRSVAAGGVGSAAVASDGAILERGRVPNCAPPMSGFLPHEAT